MVLVGNRLEDGIVQPGCQRHHGRWIALEHATGKSVHLVLSEFHDVSFLLAALAGPEPPLEATAQRRLEQLATYSCSALPLHSRPAESTAKTPSVSLSRVTAETVPNAPSCSFLARPERNVDTE